MNNQPPQGCSACGTAVQGQWVMHQSSESSLTDTDSVSVGSFLQAAALLHPRYSAKNVQFVLKRNIHLKIFWSFCINLLSLSVFLMLNPHDSNHHHYLQYSKKQASTFFFVALLRCIRKTAKHDYWLHHIYLRVHLSAWNNSAPTWQIFIKFEIWAFFENLSRKFKFH